jgi:hypothetical protein
MAPTKFQNPTCHPNESKGRIWYHFSCVSNMKSKLWSVSVDENGRGYLATVNPDPPMIWGTQYMPIVNGTFSMSMTPGMPVMVETQKIVAANIWIALPTKPISDHRAPYHRHSCWYFSTPSSSVDEPDRLWKWCEQCDIDR